MASRPFRAWLRTFPLVALFGLACTDSAGRSAGPDGPQAELLQRIAALGFRTDVVVDRGDFVVVEGDIRLKKADLLPEKYAKGLLVDRPAFQWLNDSIIRTTAPYSQELALGVNFNGLDGVSPEWATALRQAIAEWSNLPGSSILFVESGSPGNVTVNTYRSSSSDVCGGGNGTVACASLPTTNVMNASLYINLDFGYALTPTKRMRNMVHELGHNLGFRHTNSPGSPAYQVTGTPPTDGQSVMNGGTALTEWTGFSFYDKVAIRYRFKGYGPYPISWLNGSVPNISWPAASDAIKYEVYHQRFTWGAVRGIPAWISVFTLLGSTTGTSWADGTHTSSGTTTYCNGDGFNTNGSPTAIFTLYVRAIYPGGTAANIGTYPANHACFLN